MVRDCSCTLVSSVLSANGNLLNQLRMLSDPVTNSNDLRVKHIYATLGTQRNYIVAKA